MKQPNVSIVMSTYNRAHLVGEAIQSALAQTYTDLELIVVDDGSKDNTREVVTGFADPRIRYVYQENAGLAEGRNTGIEQAQGEYIAFLDDDDLYLPNKLAVQVALMEQNPEIGWTSGGYRVIDMQGKILDEHRPWLDHPNLDTCSWLFSCPTCPTAIMVRREWLERTGGFDERIGQGEDWELWLRLAYADCGMAWVESVVCCYRLHATNMVRSSVRQKQGCVALLDKFFANPALPDDLRDLRHKAYAQVYLEGACREYATGKLQEAKADIARAIQFNPHVLDDRGQQIIQLLTAWAGNPLIADPFAYIKVAFHNLPAPVAELRRRQRAAIAQVAMAQFFRAHSTGDWRTVRRMLLIAVPNDPSWLRNWGVLSISMESLVGTWIMQRVRALLRQLASRSASSGRCAG